MSTVTLYSKPNCQQCSATKKSLDRRGIEYTTIDLTLDAGALDKIVALGYKEAPVVITNDDAWSGFRPDKISALAAATSPATTSVGA